MTLVIAEQRGGVLNPATWETLAAAQQMNAPVTAAVVGARVQDTAAELAAADVAEVLAVEHEALEPYTPDGFVAALAQVVEGDRAGAGAVPAHVSDARSRAGSGGAAREGADSGLHRLEGPRRAAGVRPGRCSRASSWPTCCPRDPLHTLRASRSARTAPTRACAERRPRRCARWPCSLDAAAIRQRPEAPFKEAKQAVDLTQAERIVAVGRGIKGQEHLPLAQELAKVLDAELAASRPICDSGWLPMDRQIGSSGQTVAPKLYLAVGISGAIQHLVGMKGARTIVAVNKDADAPIFEVADYGIVGDLFEVVPAIVAALDGD